MIQKIKNFFLWLFGASSNAITTPENGVQAGPEMSSTMEMLSGKVLTQEAIRQSIRSLKGELHFPAHPEGSMCAHCIGVKEKIRLLEEKLT